ncbi:zinc dependent phospholipase C family protein [Pectinatus sottacetonis]|uniref:zinc dependent phospholipase C family protein n=1 Tax=Pectinatus sottacetonis TaxID=1002795 RepID=UPI0018C7962B|nr:zinc dependent phospholipase C family protein [Pectinatus sottacetonis]
MRLSYYLSYVPIPNTLSIFMQRIVDNKSAPQELCLTHKFCNLQTLAIIKQHGDKRIIDILVQNFSNLQSGVVWADLNFKNINHFFNPYTKKGLWKFPSAAYFFIIYLTKAEQLIKQRNQQESFFYLGAALHLLQDMSVPHHVCGYLFNGHKNFEKWVQLHLPEFKTITYKPWNCCNDPVKLFINNAKFATEFISMVEDNNTENYFQVANILLPAAQIGSAALLEWFIKNKILPNKS